MAKAVLEKFELFSSLQLAEIHHQLITNSSKTVLEQIVSDVQVSKEIIENGVLTSLIQFINL